MSRTRNPAYDEAVIMYNKGLSIQECADYFDISRQAMYMILKRREVVFRPKIKTGDANNFYRRGPTASKRAQHMVEKALRKGILNNPGICSECSSENTFKDGRTGIQAHHDDYNKPLEVRWLCQPCHHEWHKTNKAKEVMGSQVSVDLLTGGFP